MCSQPNIRGPVTNNYDRLWVGNGEARGFESYCPKVFSTFSSVSSGKRLDGNLAKALVGTSVFPERCLRRDVILELVTDL